MKCTNIVRENQSDVVDTEWIDTILLDHMHRLSEVHIFPKYSFWKA